MGIVSVSLPDELTAQMDAKILERKNKGRSQFIRLALRDALREELPVRGHLHGSVTVVYPHGFEERVSTIRHDFHDVVLSLMHTHCEPEICMDVLIVGGEATRIHGLLDRLRRVPEVRTAQLVSAPRSH